jgi:hypothetical protein
MSEDFFFFWKLNQAFLGSGLLCVAFSCIASYSIQAYCSSPRAGAAACLRHLSYAAWAGGGMSSCCIGDQKRRGGAHSLQISSRWFLHLNFLFGSAGFLGYSLNVSFYFLCKKFSDNPACVISWMWRTLKRDYIKRIFFLSFFRLKLETQARLCHAIVGVWPLIVNKWVYGVLIFVWAIII